MPTPEERASELIDAKLAASGWVVQTYGAMNLGASDGLEDSASLPDPDVLAAEIVEDLQDALEQFTGIAAALAASGTSRSVDPKGKKS